MRIIKIILILLIYTTVLWFTYFQDKYIDFILFEVWYPCDADISNFFEDSLWKSKSFYQNRQRLSKVHPRIFRNLFAITFTKKFPDNQLYNLNVNCILPKRKSVHNFDLLKSIFVTIVKTITAWINYFKNILLATPKIVLS